LWVPVAPSGHARTFNKGDDILLWVCAFERSEFAMQMIEWDIDQPRHKSRVNEKPADFSAGFFSATFATEHTIDYGI
jgi:hypothetical protein